MSGHVFVVHGDLTQIRAHAIGYSTATHFARDGNLYPAFARRFPAFVKGYDALTAPGEVGDAHWLPLGGDLPAGVVVGVAAGGGHEIDRVTKARDTVIHSVQVAVANLRRERPHERLLIALPTFRLGMGGDRHQRMASARTQLEAAARAVRDAPDVDVAFVAYSSEVYRVFLQARRACGLAPACPVPEPAKLLEALRQGRGVLFLGAGISAGAGLPGWQALVDRLSDALSVSKRAGDVDHYLDLAQWFVEKHGAAELASLIRGLYGGEAGQPTLGHYLLLALPVRVVITTNYDTLIERTLRSLRRYPSVIVDQHDVARVGRTDAASVVKLHGDAATGRGIVLARDDYDGFFRNRPAMAALLEGLLLNQTFLFAGYGLRDPNFRQIYSRIAEMLRGAEREAFAVTVDGATDTAALAADQWQRKGLHLLAMPGENRDQCVRASLLFLDWLADQVTLRAPDLFLAHDVPLEGHLVPLQRSLVDAVGREVVAALESPLDAAEALRVAGVLEFLAAQGFRPGRGAPPLAMLWLQLAEMCAEPADQRRMLVRALAVCERHDHVERLEKMLALLPGV